MSHYPVSSAFLFHVHPLQDELFLVFSHMEEPIDIVRGALIHARYLGELLFARFFHFIERAEGMPEGVPAVWTDAFDVVKDGLRISFVRPFPVIGDDEAVGFVAYELEKLESGLMVIEDDRDVAAFYVDLFDTLGEPDDGRVAAGLADHGNGRMHLASPFPSHSGGS